jgi:hypothetical protein
MEFDPFTDSSPLQSRTEEDRFISLCTELITDFGPMGEVDLSQALLTPLHRYVAEAVTLLERVQRSQTLSECLQCRNLFRQLCEHFSRRWGIGLREYGWSEVVSEGLWQLVVKTATDFPPVSFWATEDEKFWEPFTRWAKRVPLFPISPMTPFELHKHYDLDEADWHLELRGPDHGNYVLGIVRACANACELFERLDRSDVEFEHCFLNADEQLAKFRQAETMLYFVVSCLEPEAGIGRDAKSNISASTGDAKTKGMNPEDIESNAWGILIAKQKMGKPLTRITHLARLVGCSHNAKALRGVWGSYLKNGIPKTPKAERLTTDVEDQQATLERLTKEQEADARADSYRRRAQV